MPPDSGNIAPSSAYVIAIIVTATAPITQAQIAPGPARPAARQAPNSQPEPMIEPRPVSIRANGPTSRRMAWFADMEFSRNDPRTRAADDRRFASACQRRKVLFGREQEMSVHADIFADIGPVAAAAEAEIQAIERGVHIERRALCRDDE